MIHLSAPHSHLEAAPSPFQMEQGHQHKMGLLEPDEEKVRNMGELTDTEKTFLSRTPLVQTLRPTTDKWVLVKLKHICIAKDNIIQVMRQLSEWKNSLHQLCI